MDLVAYLIYLPPILCVISVPSEYIRTRSDCISKPTIGFKTAIKDAKELGKNVPIYEEYITGKLIKALILLYIWLRKVIRGKRA